MLIRRCFHFGYIQEPSHKDRDRNAFLMRDGAAALIIAGVLARLGFRYEDPIINFGEERPCLYDLDHGFLRESDLIFLTTRPPMDDGAHKSKKSKRKTRSFTTLEQKLFDGPLRRWFKTCARKRIVLTDEAASISEEIGRRDMSDYRQYGDREHRGAVYRRYKASGERKWKYFTPADALTAAFLVYAEHAWPGGPAFLAAWGMGGNETLIWCHRLAKEFPHLLCSTSFAMGEVRVGMLPDHSCTMDWAKTWEVTLLGSAATSTADDPDRAA